MVPSRTVLLCRGLPHAAARRSRARQVSGRLESLPTCRVSFVSFVSFVVHALREQPTSPLRPFPRRNASPPAAEPRQRKRRLWLGFARDERRDHLADDRPHLESMSRSAADYPHVRRVRMSIDDVVRIRRRLSYWQTSDPTSGARASAGNRRARIRARMFRRCRRDVTLAVVGSNAGPDVSSAILKPRFTFPGMPYISARAQIHPHRHPVVRESRVTGGGAEIETSCRVGVTRSADRPREQLPEPGSAGEDERIGGEGLPSVSVNGSSGPPLNSNGRRRRR